MWMQTRTKVDSKKASSMPFFIRFKNLLSSELVNDNDRIDRDLLERSKHIKYIEGPKKREYLGKPH